jgi:rhodanese-related sulfurtransferase
MLASETKTSPAPVVLPGSNGAQPAAEDSVVVEILSSARRRAAQQGLAYAGQVSPDEAWFLHSRGAAVIVDIRTAEERKFVGHVPETPHVAWATGPDMTRNPRFLRELEAKAPRNSVVLLLCRSGKRSHAAAEVAAKAGYRSVLNILEGFEGELDEHQQRGHADGWRFRGLPWTQD